MDMLDTIAIFVVLLCAILIVHSFFKHAAKQRLEAEELEQQLIAFKLRKKKELEEYRSRAAAGYTSNYTAKTSSANSGKIPTVSNTGSNRHFTSGAPARTPSRIQPDTRTYVRDDSNDLVTNMIILDTLFNQPDTSSSYRSTSSSSSYDSSSSSSSSYESSSSSSSSFDSGSSSSSWD